MPTVFPAPVVEMSVAGVGAWMAFLLRDAVERSAALAEYRAYYEGDQPHALTAKQLVILEGLVDDATPLTDNQMRVIVDNVRGRLSVAGLNCKDAAVQVAIDEMWLLNGLTARQHDVHRDVLRDGDAYVLLGWNNATGRVTLEPQRQWVADDPAVAAAGSLSALGYGTGEGMHLTYDEEGEPAAAVKEWTAFTWDGVGERVVERRRRTLYYPDRIERYTYEAGEEGQETGLGWRRFRLASDDGAWPVPWVDPATRRPLGIPVVPFLNETDATRYGVSELGVGGSLLGLQRAHNDNLHSLLAAARMTGYQMLTATGVTEEEAQAFKVGAGQVLGAAKDAARIGVIPAGDLSQVKLALGVSLETIARNADLPIHAFTGEWPSGEALMRAEIALVARARVRQERFGRAWASLMHKATMLRNAFGRERLDADALISVRWDDAAMRDELFVAQLLNAKQQPLSVRQALRELKYDEPTIDRIMGEREGDIERGMELASGAAGGSAPTPRDPNTGERLPGAGASRS